MIRNDQSTQEIVRITVEALNLGLRPHLTKWQASFRNWYEQHRDQLKDKKPQDLQKEFPEYHELIADLKTINSQLVQYADALSEIVKGKS